MDAHASDLIDWRRSGFCANSGCVEVGMKGSQVVVRDSKLLSSPVLAYTVDEWRAFVAGVKAGHFDDLCDLD
jgi:predicted secreted Zn-dependent protease